MKGYIRLYCPHCGYVNLEIDTVWKLKNALIEEKCIICDDVLEIEVVIEDE